MYALSHLFLLFAPFRLNKIVEGYHATNKKLPQSIADAIQASPNIRCLDLESSYPFRWNGTPHLGSASSSGPVNIFHDLRIYRAKGRFCPTWLSLWEASETNELRSFLQLHPHLHTVAITPRQWSNSIYIDPGAVVGLFPSLRHFEGPRPVCEAIAQSTLAPHLETLAILYKLVRIDRVQQKAAKRPSFLPELRTLMHVFNFLVAGAPFPGVFRDMLAMLAGTPNLTHLFISRISSSQVCISSLQYSGFHYQNYY